MWKNKETKNFLLRVIVYLLLLIILVFVGTGIGFMVSGGNFFQAFNWGTWQHLLDYFKR
ncbi:MAG: DNA-directed RNA polymerase subunit beta [Lactobacillaceae bacterium]